MATKLTWYLEKCQVFHLHDKNTDTGMIHVQKQMSLHMTSSRNSVQDWKLAL